MSRLYPLEVGERVSCVIEGALEEFPVPATVDISEADLCRLRFGPRYLGDPVTFIDLKPASLVTLDGRNLIFH